jgi:hypothetical protein
VRGEARVVLVAVRTGADRAAAARRAARLAPLALTRVRAYWFPRTGSGLLWLRLHATSAEVDALRTQVGDERIEIVEADRWPLALAEHLVRDILPRLDHAGDHASIADALAALDGRAIPRARVRRPTGGRTIAGWIIDVDADRAVA